MPKNFLERVSALQLAVLAISALVTATATLVESVKKALPDGWQPYVQWLSLAVLLLTIVSILRAAWLATPRYSTLVRPDAFTLRRDNRDHLVGRSDDVAHLVGKVRAGPLLFVSGDSGVGKSALLGVGLVPALMKSRANLPVYVESLAGRDWDTDAWRPVNGAVRHSLTEAGIDKLPPVAKGAAAEFNALLARAAAAGRAPILIVDQFDDYQQRNLSRFLENGSWQRPSTVRDRNAFWQHIADRIASGGLRLVIATRSDTAMGLESVRFVNPETFVVGRVQVNYIRALIDGLAVARDGEVAAIAEPGATWPDLRELLLADLERGGAVLPQQLKVALLGLTLLPRQRLTVAAYRRAGGLRGLEATWIESKVAGAASGVSLDKRQLLALLRAFVDPDARTKTRDLSVTALAAEAKLDPASEELAKALESFDTAEVLRTRPGSDPADPYWRLDHDYLAGVVDLAWQRTDRWNLLLREKRDAWTAAARLTDKWRQLMPIGTQLGFFWNRLRGRFRYAGSRPYAYWSLARFAPVVLALAVGAGGYWEYQQRAAATETARYVTSLDDREDLSDEVARRLTALSLSDKRVACEVVKRTLTDKQVASVVYARLTAILAGLDLATDGDWRHVAGCIPADSALPATALPLTLHQSIVAAWFYERAGMHEKVRDRLLKALASGSPDDRLFNVRYLETLGPRLSEEEASDIAERLVSEMTRGRADASNLAAYANGLVSIGPRVSSGTAGRGAQRLVAAIARESSPGNTGSLFRGLNSLRTNLPRQAVAGLAARLSDAADVTTDANKLSEIAVTLGQFGDRSPTDASRRVADRIVAQLNVPQDGTHAVELAITLSRLGRTASTQIDAASVRLLELAQLQTNDNYDEESIFIGLNALHQFMPVSRQNNLVSLISLKALQTTSASDLSRLVASFRDVLSHMASADLRVIEQHLASIAPENHPLVWSQTARALWYLGDQVPPEKWARLATLIVEDALTHRDRLTRSSRDLSIIGTRVPRTAAARLAFRFNAAQPFCGWLLANQCLHAQVMLEAPTLASGRQAERLLMISHDPLLWDSSLRERLIGQLETIASPALGRDDLPIQQEGWFRSGSPARNPSAVDAGRIRAELRKILRQRQLWFDPSARPNSESTQASTR